MMFLRQFLTALFFTFSFSQPLLADSGRQDVFHTIQKKGEITVGVSYLPPWVMKDKNGELIGFEIDIANQLAKDMGVKIKFKEYQRSKMIPALKKGEIDIIASGLSVTPERALEINFSNPYASSGYSMVSNLERTKNITDISGLNNKEIHIAVVKDSVPFDLAKNIFPLAKIDFKETESDAASAVVKGSVHAFISASPIPEFIALKHPDKVDLPLKKHLLTTKEAFAINKNNQEMLNYLNSWIVAHAAHQWIEGSHKYWFESLKWKRHIEDQ